MSYSCSDFTEEICDQVQRSLRADFSTVQNDEDTAEYAQIASDAIYTAGKRIEQLEAALSGLLEVMNEDKDGGWFICEEAALTVENAVVVSANLCGVIAWAEVQS